MSWDKAKKKDENLAARLRGLAVSMREEIKNAPRQRGYTAWSSFERLARESEQLAGMIDGLPGLRAKLEEESARAESACENGCPKGRDHEGPCAWPGR